MGNNAHNISVSWNRTGLATPPAKLQYSVIAAGGAILVSWTSTGLTEPVSKQYLANNVIWDATKDVTVFWQDDLGRTAQEAWRAGTGTPVSTAPTASILDKPMASVASTLISIFGASATLQATTDSTYNPRTGEKSSTTQQWTVKVSPPEDVGAHEVNGTSILTGDFRTVLPAVGKRGGPPIEPKVGMLLTWQGRQAQIINVQKLWSGSQAAGYQLLCRGGL